MSATDGFDWPGLMQAGIAGLGLTPDRFWALTPAELRLLLGPVATPPMDRNRLADLMRAFPDGPPSDPPKT
ncbi:phage tail assembly chaperone [Epibacterium sp. SM1979]|uniref:Phage tail assembly chaperone n=1 Tax=Tritonibacter litoralis TaxID=2662264 RepID=A0A843YBV9_9RHOB|nr:rcc01693 family protein [Tritonibacter litoralis]MQQ06954.1 phage tail assembly chaperone [Tritonibacter litoralis]